MSPSLPLLAALPGADHHLCHALLDSPHLSVGLASSLPLTAGRPLLHVAAIWPQAGFTLLGILFLPQDPTNLDKFNVSNFYHVKNNMKIIDPGMYN